MKRVLTLLFVIIFFVVPSYGATAEEKIRASSHQETVNPAYLTQHHLADLHKLFPPMERRKKVLCVVIDSGVQATHPVFAGHLRKDLAQEWADGQAQTDSGGHGTLVASIMLASSGGGCDIVSMKAVLLLTGIGWMGSPNSVAAALRVVNAWGAKVLDGYAGVVVNASLAFNNTEDLRELKLSLQEIKNKQPAPQIVVVAAVGNQGINSVQYPAYWAGDIREISSVGAIDTDGKKTGFSNYGSRMFNTALGVDIPGATPSGYGAGIGTSFSAPIVSGEIAALMVLAADKGWTLPPALFARIANIGDYNPNLAGMMADPPTSANGLKAWEALNKLLGLKALRVDPDRSGQTPLVSVLVQEPLDQFRGLKFAARIESDSRVFVTPCWFSGTAIQCVGPDQPGDYQVTVEVEGYKLFTVPLTVPGARVAEESHSRQMPGQGGGR